MTKNILNWFSNQEIIAMLRYIFIFLGIFIHFFSLGQQHNQASGVLIIEYDTINQHYGVALMSNDLDGEDFGWYFFKDYGFMVFAGPNAKANADFFGVNFNSIESLAETWKKVKSHNPNPLYDQMGMFPLKEKPDFVNGTGLKYQPGHSQIIQKGRFMIFGYQLSNQEALKKILNELENNSELLIGDRLIKALETGKAENVILGKIQHVVIEEAEPTWVQIRSSEPKALESLIKQWQLRKSITNLNHTLELFQAEQTTTNKNQLESVVEHFPQIEGFHSPLLKAYILLGQEEKTLQILQKAIQQEPSYKAFLPDYHILKKFDAYEKLIDSQQFNENEWNRAIKSYLEYDQIDEAIYWINQTLKKFPDNPYTYYLMGEAYAQKRNKKLARKSYQKALKIDPNLIEAKLALQKVQKK